MKINLLLLFCSLFLVACSSAQEETINESVFPGETWKVAKPESVGFSSKKLRKAKSTFEDIGGAAALVIVKGHVIADWGYTDVPFDGRSIRKSLLNAVFGIYIDKGEVDINMTLKDAAINDMGILTEKELNAAVKHLMTSSSGIYLPAAFEEQSHREKPSRGSHEPGVHFLYNNWDFNVLSTVINQASDKDLFEVFEDEIAKPLKMEHFQGKYHTAYLSQPELSDHPAYLFLMSTKDLARLGLLYLNKGKWKNQQIISSDWVIESTSKQIETGDAFYYNYGYLWWVSKREGDKGETPFLARGAKSQYMYIDPANELIIIFRDNPDSFVPVKKSEAYPLIGSIYGAMNR